MRAMGLRLKKSKVEVDDSHGIEANKIDSQGR
jgi:hypothetical protein